MRSWGRIAHNSYAQAIAVYAVVRLLGVAVLAVMASASDDGRGLLDWLTAWDGEWYLALAEHGYHGLDRDAGLVDARGVFVPQWTAYAFFPLFPALVAAVARLPLLDVVGAALLLNVAAGAVAACGILRLARLAGCDRRASLALVALVSGAPVAISLSMAYTEALFLMFATWGLAFLLERQWIVAGLAAVGAGLTRSTAVVLVAVIGLAALVSIWQRRDRVQAIVGAAIAPLGLLAYWTHVAVETGSLTAWGEIQQGWYTEVDFGQSTATRVVDVLATGPSIMAMGVVLTLLAAVVLAVLTATNRLPWPLVAYGAGFVVFVSMFSGLTFAKPRYLIPAGVVLLLPVAIGLARRQRSTMLLGTATLVLGGAWFSAYTLVGWPNSM